MLKRVISRALGWSGFRVLSDEEVRLDRLATEVAACEVIMQHYSGDAPGTADNDAPGGSPAGKDPRMGRAVMNRLLLSRMHAEPLFEPYVTNASGDALLALSFAKADVLRLEKLRSLGWSSRAEVLHRLGKALLLPVTVIALTALFGTIVGNYLQEASAQRNRAFELRLTTLRKGQEEAAAWLIKVRDLYNRVDSDEISYIPKAKLLESRINGAKSEPERKEYQDQLDEYANHSWSADASDLRNLEKEMFQMDSLSMGIDKWGDIAASAARARESLGSFDRCLNRERWDWNNPCAKPPHAKEPDIEPYKAFVASHSTAILNLLNEK